MNNVRDKVGPVANLEGLQRLYKIAPRLGQVRPLLDADINSSLRITCLGRGRFIAEQGQSLGATKAAEEIYDWAQYAHSMTFHLLVQFGGAGLKQKMPTMIDPSLIFNRNPPLTVPDWTDLFESIDMCSCGECYAMGSPAAYFVDILHFLQDRKLKPPQGSSASAQSPQVRLFERRPNLLDIELSCANANPPLPYTDLVLEILEDAVSPVPPFNEIHLIVPLD